MPEVTVASPSMRGSPSFLARRIAWRTISSVASTFLVPRGAGDADLEGERARHARRLAGVERQQQAAGAEVEAADGVDEAEADGDRPAGVDGDEALARHLRAVALAEADAAQPQQQPPPDERQERRARRLRQPHADGAEHLLDGGEPLVDAPRDEQLLGGAAAQLDAPRPPSPPAPRRGRRRPPRRRGRRWWPPRRARRSSVAALGV